MEDERERLMGSKGERRWEGLGRMGERVCEREGGWKKKYGKERGKR